MNKKKFVKIFFILLSFVVVIVFSYIKFFKNNKTEVVEEQISDSVYNSNIIKDVEYKTKDKDGNEYIIRAKKGEIDFSNPNTIFLTKVYALIKLVDSEEVLIISNFGKYNSENYDTIFSQNVIVNYLENNITSEYLDFSLKRNSMIISKKVVYTNLDNILKADVVEINVKTKDTKIYMYEKQKKVNIKSKN